ncbi:MAG TPA: glycosyltransferase family 39 protein [Solirubrobacteraceae bacterium]|nr:glycosyltransferase family 39 protein [Solirubrobacteraceae bacterium]
MSTTALPSRPSASIAGTRLRSFVRGRAGDPAWVRPALFAVLAIAALLCLWDLTSGGYSNEYYAAAAKAGSESWKAWFFGSLDPGSFITVDKPPLSLWLMGLSARAFGFSSFSILLPQALCTIAAVLLLYLTVRRALGPVAGLIAAAVLAITPVTLAIARVNNPDALLVLLLVASAYLMVRAIESGRTKFLVWCGVIVGLAFMTKLLQGWMVVPALALAYLIAGPPRLWVRIRQLLAAGAAMVLVSAAWPLAVTVWPGSKPFIGGSTDGSIWNLILGYNGFGRLFGQGGGNSGGMGFGGSAGVLRMFNGQVGGQIAWLIPLAAIGLLAGLWLTRRAPRTDLRRAALVLFGVWALVHVAIFSSQEGIFHPYYVSALAPAIAALCGAGAVLLVGWARRSWAGVAALVLAIAATAALAVDLLGRTPSFAPALRVVIPVAAALVVASVVVLRTPAPGRRVLLPVAAVAAAVAILAGPASYSIATVGRSLSGNNVMAGPPGVASGFGAIGGGGPGFGSIGGGGSDSGGSGGWGGSGGSGGARGGSAAMPSGVNRPSTPPSGFTRSGGPGGQLSSTVIAYLEAHQGTAKYLLAATGSQTTAPIIIETGRAVVTIGGFNGSDPAPTVAQLAKLVSSGQLKYVLLSSSGGGGPGGGGSSQSITTWVKAYGTAVTAVSVSGGTLYRVG